MVFIGALGLGGCGSVTPAAQDGGGGSGGGGSGVAGTTGIGGRGGSDAGGSGGSGTSNRGGTDGSGRGGAAAGGRGGSAGTSGNAGSGGAAGCARGACPALTITNLEGIDDSKAPGFDALGFRCKSLSICPVTGSCVYFSATTIFGSLQSAEDTFSDGMTATAPMPVRLSIDGGAASQCGNPPITFTADELLILTVEGARKVPVYLPAFTGVSLTLYIASDGSTYSDAALTQPARLRPP